MKIDETETRFQSNKKLRGKQVMHSKENTSIITNNDFETVVVCVVRGVIEKIRITIEID